MLKAINEFNEHTKHMLDWASFATVVGTLAKILPSIAALFSVIYYLLKIYDWFKNKK